VLTPLVRFGAENVLAVRVDHSRFADSRWYTGSGIYRHVRLRLTDRLRIAHWGTHITTPEVTADSATVRIETAVANGTGQAQAFSLETVEPRRRVGGRNRDAVWNPHAPFRSRPRLPSQWDIHEAQGGVHSP
jgi:beta-galactosidase/beta-glucuronidase